MNKIFNEAIYIFYKKIFLSQLVVLQLILSFSICIFSFCFFEDTNYKTKDFSKKYIEPNFLSLNDSFVGDYEENFFNQDDFMLKLRKFYFELLNSNKFKYIEIYSHPINILNFEGSNNFYYNYPVLDKNITPIDEVNSYHLVNAIWSGLNTYDYYDLKLHSGRWFEKNDMDKINNNDIIPVVAGYKYTEKYNVGDVIESSTHLFDGKLKIVGFLQENSSIHYNREIQILDNYIILPMYNDYSISTDLMENVQLKMLYLMKTSGTIITDKTPNYIQSYINKICDEIKINPAYIVQDSENFQSKLIYLDIESCRNLLYLLSWIVCLFICIILTLFQIIKIKQNLRYFSILLISNYTFSNIIQIIFIQSTIYQIQSLFFASLVTLIFCKLSNITFYWTSLLYVIPISLVIMIVSVSFSILKLKTYDLSIFLRKR